MITEVPRFPVIDASPVILERYSRIRPGLAREFIKLAGRKHGPLPPEGMTRDPDTLRINFRIMRQGIPGVGGGVGQHGKRLDRGMVNVRVIQRIRLIRSGLRRSQRQGNKSPFGQLECIIPVLPLPQSCGGFGFVIQTDTPLSCTHGIPEPKNTTIIMPGTTAKNGTTTGLFIRGPGFRRMYIANPSGK